MEIFLVTLAAFWVWETFRALMEAYLPGLFTMARPVHPFLAAALPLFLLWPNWVAALAVAALVGLMDVAVFRFFGINNTPVQQIQIPRRRRSSGDLPPLP